MPSPALLDIMTKQVEAERDEIISRANAEAARIRENAESRAAQKRTQTLAALDTELEAQAKRSRERAEAAAEMVALTTKDTVTDELLDEVRAELKRIAASPEFKDVLSALLAELMADAPESGIVRVPPAHADHCREWLESNGRGGMTVEPSAQVSDGVAVEDEAQTFRVTNTLTTRFERLESSLRRYCIQELFGEGA